MLKELFATCLLLYGCSVRGVNDYNVSHNSNSDNPVIERLMPLAANNDYLNIYGAYNFRDDYDCTDLVYGDALITFEESSSAPYLCLCPILIDDNLYFLKDIYFDVTDESDGPYLDLIVQFHVYNSVAAEFNYSITLYSTDTLSTLNANYKSIIFDTRQSYVVHGDQMDFFNRVFTHDDNYLTTSYSGYYNFLNGISSFPTSFGLLGYLNFNNSIYYGFTNTTNGYSSSVLGFLNYSVETQNYGVETYTVPFNNNKVVSNNILISNCKMTKTSQTRLSSIGIFQYVRDSSLDDTDFHDLLFTTMDVPVYFITQFLSFELFGMNLAVAFAGLVTLAVMLFVVRKIWTLF